MYSNPIEAASVVETMKLSDELSSKSIPKEALRYTIRIAEASDAKLLSASMRNIDKETLSFRWGDDYEGAIRFSIEASTMCWTVLSAEGELLMCFGVAPLPGLPGTGSPWMLASTAMKAYSKELLGESRGYVNLMNRAYPNLYGVTHKENQEAIRWLRWCDFEFSDQPVVIEGLGITLLSFSRNFHV